MPAERGSMRRVREILRLKHACGSSDRAIARSLGIARSTVALTLERLAAAGLAWPLPEALSDRVLEGMLYAGTGTRQGLRRKGEPDWTRVHRELRRAGVTLMLLWEEYRAAEPDGYAYSRWCELYRAWEGRLSPTMRQSHPAGDRLFVDYAGQTVGIVDGRSGEVRTAQVFVATMGASSYTYAEATWTQSLPDWIGAHARALAFMGGVPAQLVPDNPKVGVDRANWYEPGLNRTYLDMAAHYGTAILPTRVRKPRDKAKVEVAVLVVERWILARLRHRRFFSLAELNEAIAGLVTDLNARPMRRLGVSRRDLFLELDRPALKPLPPAAYEYAEWRLRRVSLDYHVDIDGHYYSVPYRLVRDQVEARLTARTVELFHKGERVAAHLRGIGRGRHTTVPEHMPSAHRRHAEWTVERIGRTAAGIGPSTAELTALILESRPHPEQGFRACLGILRLARRYGVERLEAACGRGLGIGARSYGSIPVTAPPARSGRPSSTGSTGSRDGRTRKASWRCPTTPISAGPVTTIEERTLLTHPTLDRLQQLGLAGMARAFTELEANPSHAELSHAEWLGLLLDRETTERHDRRLRARLRHARLRHQAVVEDVDYRAARGLDRALFQSLAGGRWIEEAQNLIIEGPTGVGKSWLACALGQKACRDNRSVLYQRVPKMFADLALGRGDGRYPRLMRAITGVKLLILDDWGLEPLGAEQRRDLLDIVEERYGRGATLITSQLPVDRWHDVIGDPTLADAILDRLIHNAHRIQLRGESLRKRLHERSAA